MRPGARPPQRRRDGRAWPLLLLLLLLLLGGYFAWPWLFPKEEPPPPEPEPIAAPETPSKPVVKAKPKARPKPKPVAPAKVLVPESQRQLLLKAVQSRASALKECGRPPGSPSRLLTRIGVSQPGPVKSVSYSIGDQAPKALTDCVRKKVLGWNFADVKLTSDVEILVSFSLD